MYRLPAAAAAAAVLCSASVITACSSSPHRSPDRAPAATTGTAAVSAEPPTAAVTKIAGATKAGGIAAFCTLITKNNAILTDIAAGDNRPGGVDTTRLLHDMDAAVAQAPAAIRHDMRVVVDFDRQAFTHHKELKETPQLDAALQHYVSWIGAHCPGRTS
jgi:hypothetical protein